MFKSSLCLLAICSCLQAGEIHNNEGHFNKLTDEMQKLKALQSNLRFARVMEDMELQEPTLIAHSVKANTHSVVANTQSKNVKASLDGSSSTSCEEFVCPQAEDCLQTSPCSDVNLNEMEDDSVQTIQKIYIKEDEENEKNVLTTEPDSKCHQKVEVESNAQSESPQNSGFLGFMKKTHDSFAKFFKTNPKNIK